MWQTVPSHVVEPHVQLSVVDAVQHGVWSWLSGRVLIVWHQSPLWHLVHLCSHIRASEFVPLILTQAQLTDGSWGRKGWLGFEQHPPARGRDGWCTKRLLLLPALMPSLHC